MLTASERTIRARIAAYSLHAQRDSRELTAKARQVFRDRFEQQVDPDGLLPPVERARRAEAARSAFYTRLAFQSVKARRQRAARKNKKTAREVEPRAVGEEVRDAAATASD